MLGPGSKVRWYTPVHQCPNDGAGCLRDRYRHLVKIVLCLLIILATICWLKFWEIVIQWQSFRKENITTNLRCLHTYTWKYKKILQLHHFNLDSSWSTECRLNHRKFVPHSCSKLLRCDVAKFWKVSRIYINKGRIKTEQHLFGPISEFNHEYWTKTPFLLSWRWARPLESL